MRILIITRHAGLVQWLKRAGVIGEVYTHVQPDGVDLTGHPEWCREDDLRGAAVYGLLPMRLASTTARYFEVDMAIPAEYRGKEFSAQQMDKWGATLTEYSVRKVK